MLILYYLILEYSNMSQQEDISNIATDYICNKLSKKENMSNKINRYVNMSKCLFL